MELRNIKTSENVFFQAHKYYIFIYIPTVCLLDLAEFCYNRSPQGPYTGTCTILQETINGFLCPLIVFRKM